MSTRAVFRGLPGPELASMLTIRTFRNASFRDDPRWRQLVADLVRSKDEEAGTFGRDFERCDTLYLGLSETGRALCAFMTAHEDVRTSAGDWWHTVFLGLSVAREGLENQGFLRHLYRRTVEEAIQWERQHGVELLLWGTTASPTVFLGLTHFLPETQPRRDGTFDPESLALARTLRARLGAADVAPGEHPFVVRNPTPGTLDSRPERRRRVEVTEPRRVALFSDLGVDERRHDRLLFVSQTRNSRVRLSPPPPIATRRAKRGEHA